MTHPIQLIPLNKATEEVIQDVNRSNSAQSQPSAACPSVTKPQSGSESISWPSGAIPTVTTIRFEEPYPATHTEVNDAIAPSPSSGSCGSGGRGRSSPPTISDSSSGGDSVGGSSQWTSSAVTFYNFVASMNNRQSTSPPNQLLKVLLAVTTFAVGFVLGHSYLLLLLVTLLTGVSLLRDPE